MQVILILCLVSVLFLIFITSHTNEEALNKNVYADLEVKLEENKISGTGQEYNYIIVFNDEKSDDNGVYENIADEAKNMRLSFKVRNKILAEDLESKPIIIFTDTQISSYISLPLIGDYISSGGKVVFAGGIPENDNDSYLNPIWGIVEKGSRIQTKKFKISDNFLPCGNAAFDYNGANISMVLNLNKNVKVLMESEAGVPVVYSNTYNSGKVAVINGTFLASKSSRGIFCAVLGEVQEQLIYPIIGTKSVYLDGFPIIYDGNDKNSFNLYGRSVEAFSRDVLWPELLSNSSRYGLKYTANIIGIIPREYNIDFSNRRLLIYFSNQIIRNSGELGIALDLSGENGHLDKQAKGLNEYLRNCFSNYKFNNFSVLYGKADSDVLKVLSREFGEFQVIRGVYNGEADTQQIQNIETDGEYINFPATTSGYTIDNGTYFDYLSALSEYGIISHSFNIEKLISANSEEESWYALKEAYEKLNRNFFLNAGWLKSATLSEAARYAKAYRLLEMRTDTDQNGLNVKCNNFMKGQKFFFRSNQEVKKVEGGDFIKINSSYYVITAERPDFTVKTERNV